MKTAGHSFFVLLVFWVSSVAQGQSQADLLAQGCTERNESGGTGRLWVAQVVHNTESTESAEATIIRTKTLDPGGTWTELTRLGTRVVGLAHRRSQLAVLLQDHSAMFVWRDGQSLAPRLPGRGVIAAISGDESSDGDTLWTLAGVPGGLPALATQSSTTQSSTRLATTRAVELLEPAKELLLFSLDRSTWLARAAVPADVAGMNSKVSLLAAGKTVFVAAQTEAGIKISQWEEGTGWKLVTMVKPAMPGIEDFKLMWSERDGPMIWVAGASGPGFVFASDKDWKGPGELPHNADLSQSQMRAAAYASQRLRLIYGKGQKPSDKLWEQSYDNFQPAGAPAEIVTSMSSDNRPGWPQMVLMVVVMFIALGTIRGRRVGEAGVLEDEKLALAPLGLRFAAGLVDLLPVILTLFVVALRANNSGDPQAAMFEPETYVPMMIAAGVYLLHTLITELITSRSVGKMVFGLKVVGLDGNEASKAGLAVRNLLRVIDLMLLLLPVALVLFTPLRQRLGDAAGGTVVVTKSPE